MLGRALAKEKNRRMRVPAQHTKGLSRPWTSAISGAAPTAVGAFIPNISFSPPLGLRRSPRRGSLADCSLRCRGGEFSNYHSFLVEQHGEDGCRSA